MKREEHNKKPKCKGMWKLVKIGGVWFYKCSKCGKKVSGRYQPKVNHIDM